MYSPVYLRDLAPGAHSGVGNANTNVQPILPPFCLLNLQPRYSKRGIRKPKPKRVRSLHPYPIKQPLPESPVILNLRRINVILRQVLLTNGYRKRKSAAKVILP